MAIHDSYYTNQFRATTCFYAVDQADNQVEFLEKTLPLKKEHKILDLACGFGRHSIALAKKGYQVTGYDASEDYLQEARQEAKKAGLDVMFQLADMRTLDLVGAFDVIFSLSSSLAFYDDETNLDIIRRVHSALKPSGTFVFDQGNIFWLIENVFRKWTSSSSALPSGQMHHRSFGFDATTCIMSQRSVIESGQGKQESGWDIRYYSLPEMRGIANEIGFYVQQVFGDYDGSPYSLDSGRLITVMKKR